MTYGCCGTVSRKRTNRIVYGASCPAFNVNVGEILDVLIDMSDEAHCGAQVAAATPMPEFVSNLAGTATTGAIVTTTGAPDRTSIEVLVNAQDTNLAAGEIWKVPVQVSMSDGRAFIRTFKVKVAGGCAAACTPNACESVPAIGQVISGGAQTLPVSPMAGLYYLTPPAGAQYATVQAHTALVYTLDGSQPSDTNSIGLQVPAGTVLTLETGNELANFRFTGTNGGADPVQLFATYYTGNPNP